VAVDPRDLTIVIPAYRCAKYLPATVRSALRCGEMPILIVEDHGQDGTLETAHALAEKNPGRITVVAQPKNLGMTRNWQSAMQLVKTPLAQKLDADDIVAATYVRSALEFLDSHPRIGIIAGATHVVAEDFGLDEGNEIPDFAVTAADFREFQGVDAAAFLLSGKMYPCSASTIYRMSTWQKAGGYDVESLIPDREIWYRMALHGSIALTEREAVYYRVYGESVSGDIWRGDRWCYEHSYMYRTARRYWPQRELAPLFRRQLAVNSKAFFGSSVRALKARRFGQIIPRALAGVRDAACALWA
jgi:glycosyltransferase involved in cell wall biosynthesis